MKNRLVAVAFLILSSVIFIFSCKKNAVPSSSDQQLILTPYEIKYPAHFPVPFIPQDNNPSVERIRLGRMLYYDPILSNDGRACASCHLQSYGFTIPSLVGDMPVLSHVNLAWHANFMWDGSKTGTLEDVMLFETEEFFGTDLNKINNNATYRSLFKKYFGVNYITHKEIAYALAQFTRTMISGNTKYDRFVQGIEDFTVEERKGWQLFFSEKGDCFHCHTALLTTDNQFHNTGLDSIYIKDIDKGHYNVTNDKRDIGKFRTPNLRNVALRTYYMHDGRFTSLMQVIDFYNQGVHRVNNLDPIMTKAGKENGLNLTDIEKQQLIAFLNTLTDSTFIADTAFSHPKY